MKKITLFLFIALIQVPAIGAERPEVSSGSGTASTESAACDAAMTQARTLAAQRAEAQVNTMLEKMGGSTKAEYLEQVRGEISQVTLDATRVYKKKLSANTDAKTGLVTCNATVVFAIDLSKIEVELLTSLNVKKQAAKQRLKHIKEQEAKALTVKEPEKTKQESSTVKARPNFNPFPDE